MQRRSLSFLAISLFALGANNAYAHATPVRYEPAAAALLQKIPDRVGIQLSERVEPGASDISVLGPDGSRVAARVPAVDSRDPRFYSVVISDAGEGTYTVAWQVVSADDGHFTKGSFAFSVGKETVSSGQTTGQIQIQHLTSIPQASAIGLELLGQSLLLGVLCCLAFVWRPLRKTLSEEISPKATASLGRRMSWVALAGIALIIGGAVVFTVLKTLDLDQLRGAGFAATLNVFLQTLDGSHAAARALLAGVFAVAGFVLRKRLLAGDRLSFREGVISRFRSFFGRTALRYGVLFLIVCLMILSRARVSHSAAASFPPWLSVAITALHLLAKEVWIGGLFVFSAAFLPVLLRVKNSTVSAFSLTAFSKAVSVAFGIAGVTGAYIVWLDLKHPSYLFVSEWGGRFIILSLIGGILLALRLYQQGIIERFMVREYRSRSARRQRRLVKWMYPAFLLETGVAIALIFVTSFLIITTPPYPPQQFSFERSAESQGTALTLRVHPYEPDLFLLTVTEAKRAPTPLTGVIVQFVNEENGIGPLAVETAERFPGAYTFPRNLLSLPGNWNIHIAAQRPNAFDATASFEVNYLRDVETSRIDPEHRSFGWFEMLLTGAALGIIGAALFLYRLSRRFNQEALTVESESDGGHSPKHRIEFLVSGLLAAVSLIVLLLLVWIGYGRFIKTDFQKRCEQDGNFWLQSVPMRDGIALSSDTLTGCTLNLGLYHFVDEREYAYFLRPRQSGAEVIANPKNPIAGAPADLSVSIFGIERGQRIGPAEDLGIYHDRIAHMVIVDEDLQTFAHIHSEDVGSVTPQMKKDGVFPFRYTFPKAGRYAIVVNYILGGRELSQQSSIEVGGNQRMEKNAERTLDRSTEKDFEGYRIAFDAPSRIKAGENTKLTYTITEDGKPVTDLSPYLGAAMHIAVVPADMGRIMHTHGQAYIPGSAAFQRLFQNYINYHSHFVPERFGPKIQVSLTFPQPGAYELFGEFKHEGKVVVTRFVVTASN
jgi:methionine-rich copper-binding protein CopC/putative copper export protein